MPTPVEQMSLIATNGSQKRNLSDHVSEFYNLLDYVPAGVITDYQPYLQAAITAAIATGGIVYIPPGTYPLGSRVNITGTSAIKIIGAGFSTGFKSSVITMSVRDYMFYMTNNGFPVSLVEGLVFNHTFSGTAPNDAEPSSTIDGTTGDGVGCLYIGGGIGVTVRNCFFNINTGVGCFYGGFRGVMEATLIQGGFSGSGVLNQSVGVMTRSMMIRDGKVSNCATGINFVTGPCAADFLNIQLCGSGISIGYTTLQYFDQNTSAYVAINTNAPCSPNGAIITNLDFESCAPQAAIWVRNGGGAVLENIAAQQLGGLGINSNYGIKVDSGINFYMKNVSVSGGYNTFAIDLGGINGAEIEHVNANVTTGAATEINVPTSYTNGTRFRATGGQHQGIVTGAVTLANLPSSTLAIGSLEDWMMCSDSTDPRWTGGGTPVSNVGKPITGGGTHLVLARWDAVAANWTIGG